MAKPWLVLLCVGMLIIGAGCGILGGDDADADQEEKEEAKTAVIQFGDFPQDEGKYEVIHPRKHFGKDESFAMAFQMPNEEAFDVKHLKFQMIKTDGSEDRLLQEVNAEVKTSQTQLKWQFTDADKFHDFYETGDYKMRVWRGKDLLAEGDFIITD
ncbi:hypothetical protein [Desmospora activa]|uniref:Intracellular proteinase inhibitor BsuPI n=1 Tax=Desmospora activa DSM 45169 TaxID=1121389 RepID=A0A2T4Z1Y0_9BACL|nr:hypothetical protein [Desmospora activa]PTM54762.1 hypothetical protein C8J48_3414 [Desmospora activa DSM 45169]